ncbi:MAG: DUF1244 domain-containing protein [Rhodobacteraceae bacterium]|nr:DUF1244 domain-containing protein [Paracoccaceae bacterium]
MSQSDAATMQALEAAAFRRLRDHLQKRTDVQNIDLMNMAGFCRNCLSRWVHEAAVEQGVVLGKDDAKTLVYGMPYENWKALYQVEASDAQKVAFADSIKVHGLHVNRKE